MKILAGTFSFFIAMALTSNTGEPNSSDETCQEEFQWLESQGKGICDFKKNFCGWENRNWKLDRCKSQEASCCSVKKDICQLTSPYLCHTDRVFYTMKLHYEIPEPDKYLLSVSLTTNNSGKPLWLSDIYDNSTTIEVNITVCTTPQKILIQGENANAFNSGVNGAILIFNVSFHQLLTTEAITSTAQSGTSFCADTDTTTSDNWFSSRVEDASMTTTSTLQSSDGLTTTATVVGGVVAALILLIIVVFVFLRQKKKKYKKNVPASDVPPLDVNIVHTTEDPYIAASSTSVMITPTRDQIQSNTVHQEPQHVTTCSVVVNTDTGHCNPEHPHGLSPDKCLAAQDRLAFRDNKISLDSTAGHDQGNYEYVQDPPHETPPGGAGGTSSSKLPADDVYNHTHDSVNKQIGRHGEGGGGIYSTLATEDTYSHLQGKEHHRFDRQDHGNKNPHLVTAPENHYNHL